MKLRHSARALIVTGDDRILLCRHLVFDPPGAVWSAPGGGLEPGESPVDALRREMREEVGLILEDDPPHVWRRVNVGATYVPGFDGVINDYFLVRTDEFTPRGTMSDEELAAENIVAQRWWSVPEIAAYPGPDLFGPRDLAVPLAALLAGGVPAEPIDVS